VAQSEQEVLTERLDRYPPQRYPVQHATTQFHLGSALLHASEWGSAQAALTVAQQVFADSGMRLEAAKASVMLGVALRAVGRLEEAEQTFTAAATDFAALGQGAEQAAASYNLGLVCQDRGDARGAYTAWTVAREVFLAAGYPAQAGAAARDHGGSLLTAGEVGAAVALLTEAVALAQRADDVPGHGAAANALGLAHLADNDPTAAVAVLRSALGCFPRSVRPSENAMVKANLALAHERAAEPARARLAAGQALTLTGAAAPVRQQARAVLSRLPGPAHLALLALLDHEPPESWVPAIREEVLRLADASVAERHRDLRGLLDGLLVRPGTCYDLAESLLSVVLELPPTSYAALVAALVGGVGGRAEQDDERLRAVVGSAMARFALPQWQRLAADFNAADLNAADLNAADLNAAATAADRPARWR